MSEVISSGGRPSSKPKSTSATPEIIRGMQGDIARLNADLKQSRGELADQQMKITELLAVLFTLFTFISVNITLFSKIDNVGTGILFMILMSLCCIFIVSFLLLVLGAKRRIRKTSKMLIFGLSGSFLVLTIGLGINWYQISLYNRKLPPNISAMSYEELFLKTTSNPNGISSVNLMNKLNELILKFQSLN